MKIPDFVALDIESTGLDFDKDEIIEIAMVRFIDGQPTETMDRLVRPGQELRPFIQKLTGIAPADLDQATAFSEIASEITAFIGAMPLVAHNSQFDSKFLRQSFLRNNLECPSFVFLDTLTISRMAFQESPNHKLETLISHLGLEKEQSHRALPDAMACGKLFCLALQKLDGCSDWERHQIGRLVEGTVWESLFPIGDLALRTHIEPQTPAEVNTRAPAATLAPHRAKDTLLEGLGQAIEVRPSQIEFTQMQERNLHKGGVAIIEAGTGTGKTLAYLVPSAIKAAESGERVLISTATKALQEQIWNKDIPLLRETLGAALKPALLKGRSNYLCLRKFQDHLENHNLLLANDELESFLPLIPWVENTTTGDASENTGFNLGRNHQLWSKLASESSTCVGASCRYFQQCFGLQAKRKAQQANLVITNHALFLNDLNLEFALLPPYEHAVFDEAHRLPEMSHKAFGRQIWFFRLRNQLKLLVHVKHAHKGILGEMQAALAEHADWVQRLEVMREAVAECERQLHRFFLKIGRNQKKSKDDPQGQRYSESLLTTWQADPRPCLDALHDLAQQMKQAAADIVKSNASQHSSRAGWAKDLEGVLGDVVSFSEDLDLVARAGRDDWAFWVEEPGNPHTLRLHGVPLEPGKIWRTRFYPWIKSALFTSATLATHGSLEYFATQMGMAGEMPQGKQPFCRVIDSPWDMNELRRVVIADFLPKPSEPTFQAALDDLLVAILPQTTCNSMVLYTSINSLTKSHQALSAPFQALGKTLLAQHADGNMDSLVEMFRKQRSACLMGTQMLWEGVDLPGEALEMLVIPRLPFPSPGDPLIAARSDTLKKSGGNSFKEIFVPEAILALRQGMGRLIRGPQDKGTIVILDHRALTEIYGKSFQRIWNGKHIVAKSAAQLQDILKS